MAAYHIKITAGSGDAGIAYVTILFLLVIISAMSLAFLQKAGIGSSATAARGAGMQAHYLAESAANHAMWRLLNQGTFPAAENTYYMHSLAGGRYGYKVRRHTDTTFATIATVGVVGESVVHQSYVLYIKPLASGIKWFLNSDSKFYTPTEDSWQDVDLSADTDIPNGATGVVLEIVNENLGNRYRGQVRAKGSTDNRTSRAGIRESSQVMALVKLDANKSFQAYRNDTDIKFYVRGYTGNKVTLFENWQSFPVNQDGNWHTIDLSGSGVPGNAIAILELYEGTQDGSIEIRRNGDLQVTFYCQYEDDTHQSIMVGLDVGSRFQYRRRGSIDTYDSIHLIGYMEDVGTWKAVPSNDVSGITTGSWVARDITAPTSSDARVAFLNIVNDNNWGYDCADLRENGSSDDQYSHAEHRSSEDTSIFYVVGLDDEQRFQTKIEDRDIDIYVLGYTEP